ncbi:MAG TPA: DUF1003 domain-containing protein [Methylomirabilota bacterium]|nr:DUF1003 domain-containing protein [Methylomirabilota bacterium]
MTARRERQSDGVTTTVTGRGGALPRNIEKIADLEVEQLSRRTLSERIGDRLVALAGTGAFAALHVVWFAVWIVINLGMAPGVAVFDPYPFSLLTMVVSLEAIFVTIGVLISQNRMARQADRRAHLDLQINLLAEQESTATLRLLGRIAERLGLEPEQAVKKEQATLEAETDIKALVKELDKKLP